MISAPSDWNGAVATDVEVASSRADSVIVSKKIISLNTRYSQEPFSSSRASAIELETCVSASCNRFVSSFLLPR